MTIVLAAQLDRPLCGLRKGQATARAAFTEDPLVAHVVLVRASAEIQRRDLDELPFRVHGRRVVRA